MRYGKSKSATSFRSTCSNNLIPRGEREAYPHKMHRPVGLDYCRLLQSCFQALGFGKVLSSAIAAAGNNYERIAPEMCTIPHDCADVNGAICTGVVLIFGSRPN